MSCYSEKWLNKKQKSAHNKSAEEKFIRPLSVLTANCFGNRTSEELLKCRCAEERCIIMSNQNNNNNQNKNNQNSQNKNNQNSSQNRSNQNSRNEKNERSSY
ncbi:MAG: hypothetical protein E7500_07645 [Ruminococcus sp.]|nr:hypothetical protein [Ruminococcus sp.]